MRLIAQNTTPSANSGTVSISVDAVIVGCTIALGALAIAVIRWFLQKTIAGMEERYHQTACSFKEIGVKVESLHSELQDFKLEVARHQITKTDFLREVEKLNLKLENLHR